MTVAEITMIIIGVVFMVASFFIEEKLSTKDVEKLSEMSEQQMKVIAEKQFKNADVVIDEKITEQLDYNLEIAERAMEKETNEKVMAISDFSDTVLDSMNKTHNEIMFLYSMLNDKHEELTSLAGELSEFSTQMKATQDKVLNRLAEAADDMKDRVTAAEEIDRDMLLSEAAMQSKSYANYEDDFLMDEFMDGSGNLENAVPSAEMAASSSSLGAKISETQSGGNLKNNSSSNNRENSANNSSSNHNIDVLKLHKAGKTDVEIAKELGLGLGEVKFVIGLYTGDSGVKSAI